MFVPLSSAFRWFGKVYRRRFDSAYQSSRSYGPALPSLVAQGFDRIQVRRLLSGIESEENADGTRNEE
jgi:hypothetical protein